MKKENCLHKSFRFVEAQCSQPPMETILPLPVTNTGMGMKVTKLIAVIKLIASCYKCSAEVRASFSAGIKSRFRV